MLQLILHLIGDYVTQSDWMANAKRMNPFAAFIHALVYSLPFSLIGSRQAWGMIFATHFLIDWLGLARYVVFAKNFLAPPSLWPKWEDCKATGYPSARPPFMAIWLMIICDNCLHLSINYVSLKYL